MYYMKLLVMEWFVKQYYLEMNLYYDLKESERQVEMVKQQARLKMSTMDLMIHDLSETQHYSHPQVVRMMEGQE